MITHDENGANAAEADFFAEINEYLNTPVPSCGRAASLKLLKRFKGKLFNDFWSESVTQYLPAVSEGTMKLEYTVRTHGEAQRYAKAIIADLDPNELAKAFLYGISNNAPEYRSALACYYYIKNLPEHEYCAPAWANAGSDEYSCAVCEHRSRPSKEAKYRFWDINTDMSFFYLSARLPFNINLDRAVIFLEEYKKLPPPNAKCEDFFVFCTMLDFIESLPDDTTPARLRDALHSLRMVKMTLEQTESFIDMLGYLNILHTDRCFGVTEGHVNPREMERSSHARSYFAYPVDLWTGKNGVDRQAVYRLFGKIVW